MSMTFLMPKPPEGNILLFAEDRHVRDKVRLFAEKFHYNLSPFDEVDYALTCLRRTKFDFVIATQRLERSSMTGLEFLRKVSEEISPTPRFVIASVHPVIDLKIGARVTNLLSIPFTDFELKRALR